MAGASNSFDGGTPGQAITPANSASSGTAFFTATAMTYSNARVHRGSLSGLIADGATGYVEHSLTGSGNRWVRAYVFCQTYNYDLVSLQMANGEYLSVGFIEGAAVLYKGAPGTADAWMDYVTFSPPAGWVRVELQASPAAVSTALARIYTEPESSTPTIELSGPVLRTATTWMVARYGGENVSGAPRYTDSVAWSDQDWIGPLLDTSAPRSLMPVTAVHRSATW
ncbi:hypothetical protein [Nonomuraea sp. NPDC049758]|uniref:hypothetical protein n=1 Tax=Nonomuraea sp. NPDC049758 TaxID=3154360 RepID=UPI0034479613